MKKSIFILFFLFSLFLYSKNRETELDSLFPKISEKVDSIEELIPKGWECLQKVEGDLNKDNILTYSIYNGDEKILNFNNI